METNKSKKDSVFSGIFPSAETMPPPETAPHAYKPAVSGEQMAALNNKIELMERNIVGQIEKKLAEQVPPPPPPPPPPSPVAPVVLQKITEMENRLKDFQEKFLLGAAQVKNVEESRISGRREIEELLKVVRDQQKYSELDRQMHDQLEKAWARVEEMEKRMMEVYSAAAKKPPEPQVQGASPAEIAAEVLKAVDAGLEARLKPLEAALINIAAKAEAASAAAGLEERLVPLEALLKNAAAAIAAIPAASHDLEVRLAQFTAVVEAKHTVLSAEIRELRSESAAGKERLEDLLTGIKTDICSAVGESFSESGAAFVKHADSAAAEWKERLDGLGGMFASRLDELVARGRENTLKIEALEKALSAASSIQHGFEKALFARIDEAAARVTAENAVQQGKNTEAYGLSASNTAAISAAAGSISVMEARLGGVLAGLKGFIKALEPVNLGPLLGVSGAIIRNSFESAWELVSGLEKEIALLAQAKGEMEANMKRLAPRPGGEKK